MTADVIPLARLSDVNAFSPPVETTIANPTPWTIGAAGSFRRCVVLDGNGDVLFETPSLAVAERVVTAISRAAESHTQLLGRHDEAQALLLRALQAIRMIAPSKRTPEQDALYRELDAYLFPGM